MKNSRTFRSPGAASAVRVLKHLFVKCGVALFLSVAFAHYAGAQSATGSISGLVTDAQGAAIAGAEVTATNTQTAVSVTTKTNDSGVYDIPYLKLGPYEVRFKVAGMKEAVVTGVLVDQNNISRVDRALELGNVSEAITVQASAPLLQQESTTYDATVNRKFVEDLPVVFGGGTRDSTALALLVPGVVNGTTYGSQFGVNIGGGRQFSTEFQIDGMAVAYQGVTAGVPLDSRPDQDVVSELKVQIGVPTAEYGRTSGGVLAYLTRSGTDTLHGNATGLVRNTILDARAYNAASVGRDQQWELALSIGGPVYIPKIYHGRNRTFFFFNYTAFRQAPGGNPSTVTVPTAQERNGNFSDLGYQLYYPTSHAAIPGNMIPTSQLSGSALALLKLYPAPTNSNLVNNYTGLTPTSAEANHYFAKIDHNFTDNNRLSGSFRFQHAPSVLGEGAPFPADIGSNPVFKGVQQVILSDDLVISPHLVNHIAASEEGFVATQNSQPGPADWVPIANSFGAAFPSFCFTTNGYAGIGTGLGNCAAGAVNSENDRSRDLQDAVTWNRGTHTLKFGVRYLWFQAASNVANSRNGIYQFSQSETGQVVTSSSGSEAVVPGTGNSFASFLLGAVDTANMSLQQADRVNTQSLGLYAQDDWKISRKLTVNYGLRWDFQIPAYEPGGLISAVNLHLPNAGAGNLPGAYVFGKGQTGQTSFGHTWYGAWAPRLGIAYSISPTLVFRAAAGILYAPPNNSTDHTGYSGTASANTPNGGVTPAFYWDQGWPAGLVKRPPLLDPTILNGQNAYTMAGNSNQWSNTNSVQVDIQKSFARNYVINVGYLGQSTHHLPNESLNILNQVNPQYLALGSLLNDNISNPAVAAAGFGAPYAGFTTTYGTSGATLAQALKPYPQYFSLTPYGDASGNASYNALLVKAEKRFSSGFQYLVSYTWSKTLTDSALSAFGRSGPQDTFNRGAEKALSPFDIPQNLVISFTYQLPWGPGTPFLNKGWAGNVLGGWGVSGILNYMSGTPISVTAPNTLPLGNDRLDALYLGGSIETSSAGRGNVSLANGLTGQAGTVTLNRSAFGFPAPFTFGNTFILPNVRTIGMASENLALFKRETFHENYTFELRFELFNAFNRKEFGGLVTDLTNPAFGQYTGVGIGPRSAQIAGRFVF